MTTLNLPPFEYRIVEKNARKYIFDTIRRKYVVLTPEEWVRQHFCHYLTEHKAYPSGRLANECSILVHGKNKRCDTVFYDEYMQPFLIVEYKAPSVEIHQKVFDQILRYNWMLHAEYLIVSNGLKHYCCRMDYQNQQAVFIEDIPAYEPTIRKEACTHVGL